MDATTLLRAFQATRAEIDVFVMQMLKRSVSGIEHGFIATTGLENLLNERNSISPRRDDYQDLMDMARRLLCEAGIDLEEFLGGHRNQ